MNATMQDLMVVTKGLAAIVLPLALVAALGSRLSKGGLTGWSAWFRGGILLGIGGALAVAILESTTSLVEREVYDVWVLVLAVAAQAPLLVSLRPGAAGKRPALVQAAGPCAFAASAAHLLYRGPDILFSAARLVRKASAALNTDLVLAILGLLASVALALAAAAALYRVARAATPRLLISVAAAVFLVITGYQALLVTQVLMARGVLPMSPRLLAVVIPLINGQDGFLFAELALAVLLPIRLLLSRPRTDDGLRLNPAERRKTRAESRSHLRWSGVSLAVLSGIFLAAMVGTAYANQEVRLSPAAPVIPADGVVSVPLQALEDGRLRRYAFTALDGTEVRFIAIRKSAAAYGVAFDACNICGASGYYERQGQVVCKLCDVVMNKATIGFRGGCNPVPLAFRMTQGLILIDTNNLESEARRFQ